MSSSRQKSVEIALVSFFLISLVFWFIMFTELSSFDFSIIGYSLIAYGALGMILIFMLDKKIMQKPYSLTVFIMLFIVFIVSHIYYDFFIKVWSIDNSQVLFAFIYAFPFFMIFNFLFKRLFMKLGASEPKFVANHEIFSDPLNWLFTMLVLVFSTAAGLLMPWVHLEL